MIVQNFPYEEVSLRKSYDTIGRSVNLMENTASTPYDEHESLAWDLMKRQSRTYFELEQLIHTVESLSTWRTEEHRYVSKTQKPSSIPSVLKRAKENVSEAMEPILKGILLNPIDEGEAEDLAIIRTAYLPETIIAYNTVLHAAGNLITRDSLLESMELSATIATGSVSPIPKFENEDGTPGTVQTNRVAECFVQAGRMRELVAAFALTSKVMLVLKAEGKPWRARKDRVGKELGVWEIGSAGGGDGMMDE